MYRIVLLEDLCTAGAIVLQELCLTADVHSEEEVPCVRQNF